MAWQEKKPESPLVGLRIYRRDTRLKKRNVIVTYPVWIKTFLRTEAHRALGQWEQVVTVSFSLFTMHIAVEKKDYFVYYLFILVIVTCQLYNIVILILGHPLILDIVKHIVNSWLYSKQMSVVNTGSDWLKLSDLDFHFLILFCSLGYHGSRNTSTASVLGFLHVTWKQNVFEFSHCCSITLNCAPHLPVRRSCFLSCSTAWLHTKPLWEYDRPEICCREHILKHTELHRKQSEAQSQHKHGLVCHGTDS